jgi:hypothetical protein
MSICRQRLATTNESRVLREWYVRILICGSAIFISVIGFLLFQEFELASDIGAKKHTVQILDTRTHLPLEGVRVDAVADDTRWSWGHGGRSPLRKWSLTTDKNGSFTVLVPRHGLLQVESMEKDGYTMTGNATVDDKLRLRLHNQYDKLRYLIPTVDVNYEGIRYWYLNAANEVLTRIEGETAPYGELIRGYRRAKEHAQVPRERTVLLAFCRHARVLQTDDATSWLMSTLESNREDARNLIEDCKPYDHDLGQGSSARRAYSGYLADADGVDPIPGAVVSIEWQLVPSGSDASSKTHATRLATWQVRSGRDGFFEMPAPEEVLKVPFGMTVAREGRPRIRIYALGRAILDVSEPQLQVVVDDARLSVTKWPLGNRLTTLSRPQLSPEQLIQQISAWYADAHQALREEHWPGGEKQALESYGPLLELLAEGCALLASQASLTPEACLQTATEFRLQAARDHLAELNMPPALRPTVDYNRVPTIIIGPASSETPLEGAIQPEPSS